MKAIAGGRILRVLKWAALLLLAGVAALLLMAVYAIGAGNVGRLVFGIGQTYDNIPPDLPANLGQPAILIFSKTNGFRDSPQIAAANRAVAEIARQQGLASYTTENAAVFNPDQLGRFKAVVWNSVSGDVLTPRQRASFRRWLEQGGGFVGLHGAGGDPSYAWRWYVDDLIGAQFIGHTMDPQFQRATLHIADRDHPATRALPDTWQPVDEWYSFASSVRSKGYRVLVTIDESTYNPQETLLPFGKPRDLRMGQDHPMVWVHCEGNGRALYSALGHRAESYEEPAHRTLIGGGIAWAAGLDGPACLNGKEVRP